MGVRGKKECPGCQELLGVRTVQCPKCQHVFGIKAAKPKQNKERKIGAKRTDESVVVLQERRIFTAAGACPCKPGGYPFKERNATTEEIIAWIDATLNAGRQKGLVFLREAIQSFAQQFWNVNNDKEEYERVKMIIWDVMDDDGNIHSDESDVPEPDLTLTEEDEELLVGVEK